MVGGSSSNGGGEDHVTDDKKHSWASEVEEEEGEDEDEEVKNTGDMSMAKNSTESLFPVYPGGASKQKKGKKKKKKKKSNNKKGGYNADDTVELSLKHERERIYSSSYNDNPCITHYERETMDVHKTSHYNNAMEASFQKLNVTVETMDSQSFHGNNGLQNEAYGDGWQVSGSHRSKSNRAHKHSMPPLNNGPASRPVPSSVSAFPAKSNGSKPSLHPLQKQRNHNNYQEPPDNGRQWRPPAQVARANIAESPIHVWPPPAQVARGNITENYVQAWPQQAQPRPPPHLARPNIAQNHIQVCETNQVTQACPRAAERKTQVSKENILSKLLPSETSSHLRVVESGRTSTTGISSSTELVKSIDVTQIPFPGDSDSACSDQDLEDDSDQIESDLSDSDASVKSLETRKRNKWFLRFFQTLDEFTNEQILEYDREWHCPACQGGTGAIVFYKGLQPLITHAKTRRRRAKLHREFAKVLEEDLEMRRAGTGGPETTFGKWRGLQNVDTLKDRDIVWPPMVVIQNTQLDKDDQDKWMGMGNKELLDIFKDYSPMKARHAYGPQGHRGMSVVIFAESPTGYFNAERLAKEFSYSQKGRGNWEKPGKMIFYPDGERKRILYGYMATAEDMEIFNKHSAGKSKLKWEIKKYQTAVAEPMKQMDEENQLLHYYKSKTAKQQERSKTLERSVSIFTKQLQRREIDIAAIRKRAKEQYEENQREMDDLECTYQEKIKQLQSKLAKSELKEQEEQEEFKLKHIERCEHLKKCLEEEKQEPKQAEMKEAIGEQTNRLELNLRDCEEYERKKRELKTQHHLLKKEFIRSQYEQLLNFERKLENDLAKLMDECKSLRDKANPETD